MYLSKTDFREYVQCSKCLWLKKNNPDLYIRPAISEFDQKLINEGYEVELAAREMFEKGILVEGSNEEAATKTQKLMESKASPLFQATFITESGLLAKTDVLIYNEFADAWNVYEIKSSTNINKNGSDNHIYDITFQQVVMNKVGVSVEDSYIIHLNKDYKKNGNIDLFELFSITDVTDLVKEEYDNIESEAEKAMEFLTDKDVDLNSCSCLYSSRRNHCSSFKVLNQNVPDYSIHDISRISAKNLRLLIDDLIMNIWDIPEDFKLSPNQQKQVELEKSQVPEINTKSINKTLEELEYPLIFLDYETYVSAIPKVEGFSPHQHIPFQVSIHILHSRTELTHHEYLADNIENAPVGMIEFMQETIPDKGNLISWHASFENTRNKQIAEIYSQFSEFLLGLNDRTFDLETIFKDDYRHPGFKGRTSIKKVLPVLCPEFSYKDLEIQNGTEAMENWNRIIFDKELEESERSKIQESLLKYCELDTKAMVKIFKHLLEI
ncbi:MAG: hypothetical protein DHS20C13_12650 [Thermodesulfobacteriota bacterium]|nr:MAG: hypothetical protein DHS20C13_12650 [Thermodesulfobacteriota bacterium]